MRLTTLESFTESLTGLDISIYTKSMKGRGSNRVKYWNIAAAYDTETTNVMQDYEKLSHTYAFMFSIDNKVEVLLRTWEDALRAFEALSERFSGAVLPIYVHGLSFDFAALHGRLKWSQVFSIAPHKPTKARHKNIELRDSGILIGTSLEEATKSRKVKKAVGSLDYSLPRHSETPLTALEQEYCFKDVESLVEIIKEKMKSYDLAHIPMTSTGYVREHVRNRMLEDKTAINQVHSMTIEYEEYEMLKEASFGAFTHGAADKCGEVLHDVDSWDKTSEYPSEMVREFFPMSKGERVEVESMSDFVYYLQNYLSIFTVTFYDIKLKKWVEDTPINMSATCGLLGAYRDNGRIWKADILSMTVTNIDFNIIRKFYDFDSFDVKVMYIYKPGYLPTTLVKCILELYIKKTELKGIAGSSVEYEKNKHMLNSYFGMTITDPMQELIEYDGKEWTDKGNNLTQAKLDAYNNNPRRFLSYTWGVFTLAYGRRDVLSAVLAMSECGAHVYSDTDSEKCTQGALTASYFEESNKTNRERMDAAMRAHGLPESLTRPKNKKGEEKQLGDWDYEGKFKLFKFLGSKRYIGIREDGSILFTVAGVKKKGGIKYLLKCAEIPYHYDEERDEYYIDDMAQAEKVLDYFDEEMCIPADYTGKMSKTYINDTHTFTVVDYLGKSLEVTETGGCYLEPEAYTLNVDQAYIDYCLNVKKYRVHYYE